MQIKKYIDVDDLILFIVVLLSFCAMRTVIRYGEKYLVILGILLCVYKFVKNSYLFISLESKVWIIFCVYVTLFLKWSCSVVSTIKYIRLSAFVLALMMIIVNKEFIIKYIKIMYVGCVITAISIMAELINPLVISKYFWYFFEFRASAKNNIAYLKLGDRYNGAYSGLIGEKGDAAFFMCLGLAIVFSKCFARKKVTRMDIISIVLLAAALLLTGKRMLFLISMTLPLLLILLSDMRRESKVLHIFEIGFVALLAFAVIINVVPDLAKVFERLNVNMGQDAAINERYRLWDICLKMFLESPIIGQGLAGFNQFSYNYGNLAGANAHNIYIQLLGETGLLGASILVCFIISTMIKNINIYRCRSHMNAEERNWMYFAFCGQFIFLVYGITGNTFYYSFEFIMYVICLLIINILSLQLCRMDRSAVLVRGEHG
ncbi:MAG TPA: O-antigen ligase family protein [Mobilitalea sp.]|nr:O-antigen ligase family protein [Mobilitalea sp.]